MAKMRPFQCPTCLKRFTSESGLNMHRAAKHEPDQKKIEKTVTASKKRWLTWLRSWFRL